MYYEIYSKYRYDKAIKSAGRLFLQIYRSLQEVEQKYSRENEGKDDASKSLLTRMVLTIKKMVKKVSLSRRLLI